MRVTEPSASTTTYPALKPSISSLVPSFDQAMGSARLVPQHYAPSGVRWVERPHRLATHRQPTSGYRERAAGGAVSRDRTAARWLHAFGAVTQKRDRAYQCDHAQHDRRILDQAHAALLPASGMSRRLGHRLDRAQWLEKLPDRLFVYVGHRSISFRSASQARSRRFLTAAGERPVNSASAGASKPCT